MRSIYRNALAVAGLFIDMKPGFARKQVAAAERQMVSNSLLILISAASLIASLSQALGQTKMTIGYSPSASWAGAFVAADQGYFKAHNIDAQLTLIAVSPSIPPALIAGSLQAGGLAVPDLLHAVDAGVDLVAIAGSGGNPGREATQFMGMGLFARTGVEIAKPGDLVGKTVGVPGFGTAIDISFRYWLFQKGVDLKSVTFVEIPFPQGSDALKAKLVDAVVSNTPFTGRITGEKTGYLAIDYARDNPPTLATVFVATRDWAEQHGDAVAGFKAALKEASKFVTENPDATKAVVAKYTKLPPQAQASILLLPLQTDVSIDDLKHWADEMIELGIIKTSPDLSKLVVQ